MKRRIFISSPRDKYLDERQKKVKQIIKERIAHLGYEVQMYNPEDGGSGEASGKQWTIERAEKIISGCVGTVLIGFPFWKGSIRADDTTNSQKLLVTEYCHYEGAIARACQLPVLMILEDNVEPRVIFSSNIGESNIEMPDDAQEEWFSTNAFIAPFTAWNERIKTRYDIFLGYCSTSVNTAKNIERYITEQIDSGIKILDWRKDFTLGDTIINQINKAAKNCTGGIFLFTKDDEIVFSNNDGEWIKQGVPRDNVVFEAGYFAHAKGTERVLIISETGCKMPADLGGIIYADLENKNDISSLQKTLLGFLNKNL